MAKKKVNLFDDLWCNHHKRCNLFISKKCPHQNCKYFNKPLADLPDKILTKGSLSARKAHKTIKAKKNKAKVIKILRDFPKWMSKK